MALHPWIASLLALVAGVCAFLGGANPVAGARSETGPPPPEQLEVKADPRTNGPPLIEGTALVVGDVVDEGGSGGGREREEEAGERC